VNDAVDAVDAVEAVRRVGAAVSYLRVVTDATSGGRWIGCEDLIDHPDGFLELVRSTRAGVGTDRDDVAMSLFVQGWAFRVASLAVGAWLLDGVVLDVAPAQLAIAIGRDRPNAVLVRVPAAVATGAPGDPAALDALRGQLVDGHLAPLVASARRACRVGERLLWSNAGSSCAVAFATFNAPLPDRRAEIRDRSEAFFAGARPELTGSGKVVRVGEQWAWERHACCLWYRTTSGAKCADCSLWTAAERAERYARMASG
jgi:ferric iron reductase protein FhuF